MDNGHLKNQFDFDLNGYTNVFDHFNLIAIEIFLVGITLTHSVYSHRHASTFSHMYMERTTAQFGTVCSLTPAKSAARWFMGRRGIMGPRLSEFPPGHMYMQYNV